MLHKPYLNPQAFEDFTIKKIIGQSFKSHGASAGDIGNVLETECFGTKLKNSKHDIDFVENYPPAEIKVYNKNSDSPIHISRTDKKKHTERQAKNYAVDKIRNTYLFLAEKCKIETMNYWTKELVMVDGWKYIACYKLGNLNEAYMSEKLSIRSDKGHTKYATSISFKNFWNSFAVHNQIST